MMSTVDGCLYLHSMGHDCVQISEISGNVKNVLYRTTSLSLRTDIRMYKESLLTHAYIYGKAFDYVS